MAFSVRTFENEEAAGAVHREPAPVRRPGEGRDPRQRRLGRGLEQETRSSAARVGEPDAVLRPVRGLVVPNGGDRDRPAIRGQRGDPARRQAGLGGRRLPLAMQRHLVFTTAARVDREQPGPGLSVPARLDHLAHVGEPRGVAGPRERFEARWRAVLARTRKRDQGAHVVPAPVGHEQLRRDVARVAALNGTKDDPAPVRRKGRILTLDPEGPPLTPIAAHEGQAVEAIRAGESPQLRRRVGTRSGGSVGAMCLRARETGRRGGHRAPGQREQRVFGTSAWRILPRSARLPRDLAGAGSDPSVGEDPAPERAPRHLPTYYSPLAAAGYSERWLARGASSCCETARRR